MGNVCKGQELRTGLFRSEAMSLVQIIMHKENVNATMKSLGKVEHMHLVDLNTDPHLGSVAKDANEAHPSSSRSTASSFSSSLSPISSHSNPSLIFDLKKRIADCVMYEKRLEALKVCVCACVCERVCGGR